MLAPAFVGLWEVAMEALRVGSKRDQPTLKFFAETNVYEDEEVRSLGRKEMAEQRHC